MARTIQVIYDSLVAAKAGQTALDGLTDVGTINYTNTLASLNNGSRVSVWRLLLYVQAFGIWVLEGYFDLFKSEVDEMVRNGVAAPLKWIAWIAKQYQHGDTLSWSAEFKPFYGTIDTSKQIVKYSAATEQGGVVTIKVAKLSGGLPVKLASGELAGFTDYMKDVKPGGMQLIVRTADADSVLVNVDLFYNSSYTGAVVAADARQALSSFLQSSFFGERIKLNAIEDVLQAVAGVVDVRLQVVKASAGGVNSTIYDLSQGVNANGYNPFAGYMVLNNDSIFNTVAA